MRAVLLLLLLGLGGCVSKPISTPALAPDYRQVSSNELWSKLTYSNSARELMIVEAELAARGETSSGVEYLGRRTSPAVGVASYSRNGGTTPDRDCSDYSSSADAQRFFLSAGGPASDPHGLDRDGDGYACEFGTAVLASAARNRSRTDVSARLSAPITSSQCFTGRRGGTYTITASGNKNYDGC
ncbi:hypothetical protein HFN07_12115 [Rhizobium leguminosarum]|nr:hypothetical protein [Rhizobium leguminosarum]